LASIGCAEASPGTVISAAASRRKCRIVIARV
jgi:hypothetical protein